MRDQNVGAPAFGDDSKLKFVIHYLAVARPFDGGIGALHAEAVGDVVDRLLAVNRRQFGKRFSFKPRQFGHIAIGPRL